MISPDAIRAILSEQVCGYRLLLDVLQRERASLLRFDPQGVESLSKEKDTIVLKLKLLEEERIRLVSAFAVEHAVENGDLLGKLSELSGNDSFQRLRSQLISLLQSITELNSFNRVLIERSSSVVKNALNFLGSFGRTIAPGHKGALLSKEA